MKRDYEAPELLVEKFSIPNSVIATSGIEGGDTEVTLPGEGEF